MKRREYYSVRTGKAPEKGRLDLTILRRLFYGLYKDFDEKGYFQQSLGYLCVTEGFIPGLAGKDVNLYVLRKLRKEKLWPIHLHYQSYTEDDIFDLIEFLYDHVAQGTEGSIHSYNNCGYHYSTFDRNQGQADYLSAINDFLPDYDEGFELSPEGEILSLPGHGLEHIFNADLPSFDPDNVEARVQSAVIKFRRRTSSLEDRKDALRDLADVLEFLRPQIKAALLSDDERDLFNIANNFGIRHHNDKQKTNYDKPVWYSWMFYYYLATIHASIRLIQKAKLT